MLLFFAIWKDEVYTIPLSSSIYFFYTKRNHYNNNSDYVVYYVVPILEYSAISSKNEFFLVPVIKKLFHRYHGWIVKHLLVVCQPP